MPSAGPVRSYSVPGKFKCKQSVVHWWQYIFARIVKNRRKNQFSKNFFMDPSYRNYFYCYTCKILKNPNKKLPDFY
jgi:hypothetical protein